MYKSATSPPVRRALIGNSANVGKSTQSPRRPVTKSAAASEAPAQSRSKWRAEIVADDKTKRVTLILMFPTYGGKDRCLRGPAERRENLAWVRKELLGYDAALPGPAAHDCEFIKRILDGVALRPLIETHKPGFTPSGRGFVLGDQMLGDAKDGYWWRDDPDEMNLGAVRGTKSGWDEVGKLLRHSSFISLAVLAMLASPVLKYVELRASKGRPRAPLVSETATFNFVGRSASGKTLALEVAASVSGPPNKRSKWDFSRRGAEEYLESRNQVGAIFDDVEKHIGEYMKLTQAIAIVTQYVPEGSSKELSGIVRTKGLDRLTWQTFALSSSPLPIDKFVPKVRTDGEKVRFMDLTLPPRSGGGIIDAPLARVDRVKFGIETAKKIELGIAVNSGHLMPAWIEVLLAKDCSDDFEKFRDFFVHLMVRDGSAYERRFAQKFGVLYAVGKVAVKFGVLPWPSDWPFKAIARCYRNALAAANREKAQVARALGRLQKAVSDGRLVAAQTGSPGPCVLDDEHYGVLCRYKGDDVVAVLDAALQSICGGKSVMKALVSLLKSKRIYQGGHGHAGTTQIGIRMRINGKLTEKPRFWIFNRGALMQMGRTPRPTASAASSARVRSASKAGRS